MILRPRHLLLPLALTLALTLSLCGLSVQAQQTGGLQQRMSQAEFEGAGLNKLSPQELQNLDTWLNTHGKVTTKMVNSSGAPEFYPGNKKYDKIETHLVGHFDGWHGRNVMTLDNGQVWKQVGSDAPTCMTSDHPSVKVKPSLMGNWLMFVEGCNDTAHVQRIR